MKMFLKPEDPRMDRLGQIGFLIARLGFGILWFTQLLWKLPPTFGCRAILLPVPASQPGPLVYATG